MGDRKLTVALGRYPMTEALFDRRVSAEGVEFSFQDVPLQTAFRDMVREQRFDICEMALTTVIAAGARPQDFVALPVFLVRSLPFDAIVYDGASGVTAPLDLHGQQVGIRAVTGTAVFWIRGILSHAYGVDLDQVTWISVDEDYIRGFPLANNVQFQPGRALSELLTSGEIRAAINPGSIASADIRTLLPDPKSAAAAWLKETGVFPLNHTVVIRKSLVDDDPALAGNIYRAFEQARELSLASDAALARSGSESGAPTSWSRIPLIYGVDPNRRALEMAVSFAVTQEILDRHVPVEELFASL